jgi:hypothetical protein
MIDFFEHFSYYSQKMVNSPYYFGPPVLIDPVYSEFFLRLAIGFYMLIFQPRVNFCPHENIQPSFVVKLWDMIMYMY